jgi:TPR repeat protein
MAKQTKTLCAAATASEPLEDAKAAYDKGDYAAALRLFRSLSDQGNALAQQRLGAMYERGLGVPEDYAEAVRWYRRAADQGFAISQWALGIMYETGYGVPLDYVQAHMWCNLSATQGFNPAILCRAEVEKAMTPAQVAEAQKLARDWKPKPEQ